MQDVQESKPQVDIDELASILQKAGEAGELTPVETTLQHYHTDQLYGRRIVIPAPSVFTTYVHKVDHISIALRGHITVVDHEGNRVDIVAPDAFVTKAGTQRVIYVHEEVEFMTVHPCAEQDLDAIEKTLVCSSMAEYNAMNLLEAPV